MEEEYKIIPGFEDYRINEKGVVINKSGDIMKPKLINGYETVCLRANGKSYTRSIRKLIEKKHNTEYKIIPGFEDYKINEKGDIINKKGNLMKPLNTNGYKSISLRVEGKSYIRSIKKLIQKTYNPKEYNIHKKNIKKDKNDKKDLLLHRVEDYKKYRMYQVLKERGTNISLKQICYINSCSTNFNLLSGNIIQTLKETYEKGFKRIGKDKRIIK